MCGITSFFSFTNISKQNISSLQKCNLEMLYRGPDENDIWHNEKVALAHVRLSIIGVSNGHQPLFNEQKDLTLICNGEIYNYFELKEELENKGHTFSTQSDCEVIIHLYEEYGDQLNDKLDGMYAYCLYDSKKEKFLVARDRVGKKPLYYAILNDGIVFSSELKVIKNQFISSPEINFEILRQTQKYTYSISSEDTYIQQIKKIPAGCYGVLDAENGIKINKYCRETISPNSAINYNSACENIRALFLNAVKKRLHSEVPIAVLLSAGVDSSAIACAVKELGHEVHVLSAGYKGKHSVDERHEAKKLSDEKGFIWHEIELDAEEFEKSSNEIYSILDEPNGDVAMFAQYALYKKAKELGFTVLLSGNGGDELFYGYHAHNVYAEELNYLKDLNSLFPISSKKAIAKLLLEIPTIYKKRKSLNIHHTFPVYKSLQELALKLHIPFEREDWHRINTPYYIDKVYHFLKKAWLTNNCYFLADKLAMAHSIEVRCPFADRELINYVNTLTIENKFPKHLPKQLLKDALKDLLPDYVINRQKTGFTPPFEFINKMVNNYKPVFFEERPTHFSQLITDHFASKKII